MNAASPVIAGSQVFISASYKTGGALLNLPGGGVAWSSQNLSTHFNTAIYKDGYLYGFDGRNEPDASLVCIDVKTGKVMWRVNPEWDEFLTFDGEPRKAHLGIFRGTLLWVDGKFLCLGEMGHLLWLDLTPSGYKELARAWLFPARETWALPVLSRCVRGILVVIALGLAVVFAIAIQLDPYQGGEPWRMGTHTQLGLPPCTFKTLTGLPCPSCGMTTSFALLVRGDVINSARANFVGTLLAVVCLLAIPWGVTSLVRGRLLFVRSLEWALTWVVGIFLTLLLVRWAIVVGPQFFHH